jgi:hypothetical protein
MIPGVVTGIVLFVMALIVNRVRRLVRAAGPLVVWIAGEAM